MSKIIKNETFEFDENNYVIDNNLFCKNWTDLFDIILK